ncbi:YgjV family protein [Roseovarius sp. CAU 1744]|uniref:YgjV family protein n=1 Tax=Roseovarius sp. CAU 1744 TaxID=3140368 RepID=UPI00325B628A
MTGAALMQDAPMIVSGVAAATCLTLAPAFRARRSILLCQLAAALFFAAHYIFLGIAVASAVNILSAIQTGAAVFAVRSTAMRGLGYVLICLMGLVGLWFWQGPVSGLSVAATILIATARMQADQVRLRLLLLAGGCFWTAHDFAAEAWIALAADLGALAMGLVALATLLVRVTIVWRPSYPNACTCGHLAQSRTA